MMVFLAPFLAVVACSDDADDAPAKDPPVATQEPSADPDAGYDAGNDASPPDAEPPPVVPASCSGPLAPVSCPNLAPAPVSMEDIETFVQESAIPLRCGEDAQARWDVGPLVDLYGSQKIFMMGEVHGTNEIGILSSIVFEELAKKKQVNVLAFEVPMEIGEYFDRWIHGDDSAGDDLLSQIPPNMFAAILPRTARALVEKGIPIHLVGVDHPYFVETPIAAIKAIAAKLTTQKDTVLATLPNQMPTEAEADAYFDHVMASKDAICAELTAADCDRLDAMTHALWVVAASEAGAQDDLWMARREEVIYYNMKSAMPTAAERMYLHMGAFHTNKHDSSAGSRMAHAYELTKDKVFSVAPAYGDGSVTQYGEHIDLPGEPSTLATALTDAPPNPLFVSTTRPNAKCETNPLGLEAEATSSGGSRGETYDGYIHYGQLTPEDQPDETKFQRDIPVANGVAATSGTAVATGFSVGRFLEMRARIEATERAVLADRAVRRGTVRGR